MKDYYVIGLMSGTSIDGVDLVYVRFSHNNSWSFKIINSKTYDYDNEWQYILKSLTTKDINSIKKID
ncbi:MAG: anhydro-N-acetylmuramic acid kinase, partial [Flavobacteriaceae bacterium]|nr:anhydro-N-acetylmuramic acid kinase [Flavobacteriaceae bacterium]